MGLGFGWAPFMFLFWVSGLDGRVVTNSLYFLLSGSWVGWMGRDKKLGFYWALFIFSFWAPGSDG